MFSPALVRLKLLLLSAEPCRRSEGGSEACLELLAAATAVNAFMWVLTAVASDVMDEEGKDIVRFFIRDPFCCAVCGGSRIELRMTPWFLRDIRI